MKAIRMILIGVRDAFKSVFRNFSLSLASIICIAITLVIVSVSMIATINVDNFTKFIKKDVTMVVYLNKDVTLSHIESIKNEISKVDNIDSIEFKSNEDARLDMMKDSEIFNEVMKDFTEKDNPLKHSFLIKVKDINEIKNTANSIKKISSVAVVDYGEGMVEKLISTFDSLGVITFSVVLLLVLVTVFLIINTIKLTIFSRKREISIMRLVGASNFFIKVPFVIEGMVLGLIGAIIPVIFTLYGYMFLYNNFDGKLFSPLLRFIKPEPFIYQVSGLIILIGIVVGMIGSYRAVQKYLKV